MIRTWMLTALFLAIAGAISVQAADVPIVILVQGAAGEPQYGTNYLHQVELWRATAERAGAEAIVIGAAAPGASSVSDRDQLQRVLKEQAAGAGEPLWLVLIGHGTYDGKAARFNLRGPDIAAADLAPWLEAIERPVIVINTASASAPFLPALAGPNRILISATRSGSELNYARFGRMLAEALADPESDLDRDEQTSLLEAFLAASARVRDFYVTEGRLATEHALIEDNGDGKGTPADWFRGVRARRQPDDDAGIDGARAHQIHLVLSPAERRLSPEVRLQRDALEQQVFALREHRGELAEDRYLQQLETLLLQLARLYHPREAEPAPPPTASP